MFYGKLNTSIGPWEADTAYSRARPACRSGHLCSDVLYIVLSQLQPGRCYRRQGRSLIDKKKISKKNMRKMGENINAKSD